MTEQKATILVVDDEEYTRKLLERVLGVAHCGVVTAASGEEALRKIISNPIDLVLLDIKMPGMNGYQVLDAIRQTSDIPVIMVTGVGLETSLQTSFDLGADDYIKKPFRSSEVLARIEAKLRRIRE